MSNPVNPSSLIQGFIAAIAAVIFEMPVWAWSRIRQAGTHSGIFHADELIGFCLILEAVKTVGGRAVLKRTRDQQALDTCDVVFDVAEGRYDHHGSRSGLDPCGVPWCAATRLWWDGLGEALLPGDRYAQGWFYANVLAPVAWQDNGKECPAGFSHPFNWIHHMNPVWDAEDSYDGDDADTAFHKAVTTALPIVEVLLDQARAASRAQSKLEVLPDDDIVVIPAGLPGWAEFLAPKTTKFVVFKGNEDTPWYAQCVPLEGDRFSKKCPFPADWAGRRGDDLSMASGVAGAIFCHINQFISGWKTEGDAKFACTKALRYDT